MPTDELDLKSIATELGRIAYAIEAIALKKDPDFLPEAERQRRAAALGEAAVDAAEQEAIERRE